MADGSEEILAGIVARKRNRAALTVQSIRVLNVLTQPGKAGFGKLHGDNLFGDVHVLIRY